MRLATVGCLALFTSGVVGAPRGAEAQQTGKGYRIGWLLAGSPEGLTTQAEAFRQGLRHRGYVVGRNLVIEYRFADGRYDRLPALAAELAALKVDVIVTAGHPAASALKAATTTVPIVAALVGDPVATGLVASYARPGGNITGLSFHFPELMAKRIEVLREALPHLDRVGVVRNTRNPAAATVLGEMEKRARILKVELNVADVREPTDLDTAFAELLRRRSEGVVVVDDPMLIGNARPIADLALKHRLPVIGQRPLADAGGLLSYGPNVVAAFRQSAVLVDKILKGAKPADLPIQQAERIEFVVNLKTARALGLTLPPALMVRADTVLE